MQINSRRNGFALLQILIMVSIMVLASGVALFSWKGQKQKGERQLFVSSINALAGNGWKEAISSGKAHRVFFDLNKRTAHLEIETNQKDDEGKVIFSSLAARSSLYRYIWTERFVIKGFLLEGTDEFTRYGNNEKVDTVWFYIMPAGTAQETVITVDDANTGKALKLVLNPFMSQFKVYEISA